VTVFSVVTALVQVVLVAAVGPILVGVLRQLRARVEGRVGAGILQPWRDLIKLLRREPISAAGTSWVLILAPVVLMGTSLAVAVLVPYVSTRSATANSSDLFAVVALLLVGTVVLTLAGLDTGTAFGGMGASREITIAALVEPAVLLAVFALSPPAGSTNLAVIVARRVSDQAQLASPVSLLVVVALMIVTLAEAGRLPVDNPATHLELTMIHEAMVLEYSGRDLALVEWASSIRLVILLGLTANLFLPWGVATQAGALALLVGVVAFLAKLLLFGAVLGIGEVFIAKFRLFRVPELLAGAVVLGFLAVMAAFFLVQGSG